MRSRIKGWFELSSLTGLEITLGQEGISMIQACTLGISAEKLSIKAQDTGLKNLAHFAKCYTPQPVALWLSGKGILSRQIQQMPAADQQLLNLVLPNANAGEFYLQAEPGTDHTVVSLVRKTGADELVEALKDLGFTVISLNLGPKAGADQELPLALKPELRLAYQAAFQTLLGMDGHGVDDTVLVGERIQVLAKVKVMGIAAVSGTVLLLLLLINFFLFSHYQDASGRLALKKNRSGMQVQKFQQMETGIADKTALLTKAGWTGGYPNAWLTDQLLAGRPGNVMISNLSINPLRIEKAMGSREEIYENALIRISGSCDKAATLNNWLFEIRSKNWVKECGIRNYQVSKESGKGEFTIDIQISDYEG
ncbi:MAG: hypothetical protein V4594_17800 [Bacteroidota bacterium]